MRGKAVAKTVKAVAAIVFGAGILAFGAIDGVVAGQANKKKPMTLTGADYGEIQVLNARYTHAIDSCSNDGYDYADLYTPDGTFIDMWTQKAIDAGGEKWQGREKLREISSGANVTGAPCTSTRFNGSVTHMILNLVITPTADGATGNSYMVELGGRDPNRITRMGNYEDVYVKTPGGWKYKTRIHSRAPNGTKPAPAGTTPPAR